MQRRVLIALLLALVITTVDSYLGGAQEYTDPENWRWVPVTSAPVSGGHGQAIVGTGDAIYLLRCMNASSQPEFYRYHPVSDQWFPASTKGLEKGAFRNGTCLAWDYCDAIYALAGAKYADTGHTGRRGFYRYTISIDQWERLPDTRHDQGPGNALIWWQDQYWCEETRCPDDPPGAKAMMRKLVAFVGSTKHNKETSYHESYLPYHCRDLVTEGVYDVFWDTEVLPWDNTDDGAALAWTGDNYVYALRGEYEETIAHYDFARLDICSSESGELSPLDDPGGVGDGASLLWIGYAVPELEDYVFALGGGKVVGERQEAEVSAGYGFYRYSIAEGKWQELPSLPCPIGKYNGNRLAFAHGHIYYWQGWVKEACGGNGFFKLEW